MYAPIILLFQVIPENIITISVSGCTVIQILSHQYSGTYVLNILTVTALTTRSRTQSDVLDDVT